MTGETRSSNFPLVNAIQSSFQAAQDSFVTEVNATGASLVYSTYLGGGYADGFAPEERGWGIAVDNSGNAYVTGGTTSGTFPVTGGAFQTASGGGLDAYLVKITQSPGFAVSAPTGLTAGTAFNVTVTALTPSGGVNTGYSGTVHFACTDPLAVLPADYTFTTADQGVHTFSITLKRAGQSNVAVLDTTTPTLTGNAFLPVSPAAASTFTVAGFPSPTTAGNSGTFTVTAYDPYGNVATGYTGTVHFTSSDPQASLPANYTFTASDAGRHSFSATLKTAGTQSLTATDTVTGTLTGTQSGIVVNPAGAASLAITGLPASVKAGTAYTFTVTAKDAYGNTATGYAGTVHFTSSDRKATLPANYTFTATDNGVHTFTNGVTFKTTGKQTLTATDTVTGTITGTVTVTVSSATASALLAPAQPQEPAAIALESVPPPATPRVNAPPDPSSPVAAAVAPSRGNAAPALLVTVRDAFFAGASTSGDGDPGDWQPDQVLVWLRAASAGSMGMAILGAGVLPLRSARPAG